MNAVRRRSGIGKPVSWSFIAVIGTFLAAPVVLPITLSVSDAPYLTFPPQGFTLRWFAKIFSDGDFLESLWLSLALAALVTVLSVMLGVSAALAMKSMPGPVRGWLMSALMAPMAFPTLVTGAALLQYFALLGSDWTLAHLTLGHTVVCAPYVLRTVAASLGQVRPNIEDAARTLGAGELACFREVTLPQIAGGVSVGAVFAFITSFDNFPVSLWLADARHVPLPLTIYNYIERFFDPTVAAVSAVTVGISAVAILALERLAGLRPSTVAA